MILSKGPAKDSKEALTGRQPSISRLYVLFLQRQVSKMKEFTELQKDSAQKAEKKSLLAKKRQ